MATIGRSFLTEIASCTISRNIPDGDEEASIATIGRRDEDWQRIFTLPNLVELTLHESDATQLEAVHRLPSLRRLRITHARPKSIEFLSALINVEELVLEYVSGFSDLSPLRMLQNLRSLHIENLRRVTDFSGLTGILSLRYLGIDGTLDWKQPIADFQFLSNLPNLEVLSFGQVINQSPYPALLPAIHLSNLKRIRIAPNIFPANEYALLEVALAGVEGAVWEPCKRFTYSNSEWFDFLGKGAGRVKCDSASAVERCAEYAEKYSQMKGESRVLLSNVNP